MMLKMMKLKSFMKIKLIPKLPGTDILLELLLILLLMDLVDSNLTLHPQSLELILLGRLFNSISLLDQSTQLMELDKTSKCKPFIHQEMVLKMIS